MTQCEGCTNRDKLIAKLSERIDELEGRGEYAELEAEYLNDEATTSR